jgi:hypothetical protein
MDHKLNFLHKELAKGRWFELSLMEQLANVGTDIERTIQWKKRGKLEDSQKAFERALDLLTLTIIDPKHKGRLKELTRTREALIDYFMYDNEYQTSDEIWQKYFYSFNYAAALQRGK